MSESEGNGGRRYSDEMLFRLDEKVKIIDAKLDKHLLWAESEDKAVWVELNAMKLVWKAIETPIKWVGWAVTIFFAVLITSLATHSVEWFKAHWGK